MDDHIQSLYQYLIGNKTPDVCPLVFMENKWSIERNNLVVRFVSNTSRALLKTHFEILKQRFFSETRRQKRSLAALNEYFGNLPTGQAGEVSGKKIISKIKSGFMEVPSNILLQFFLYERQNLQAQP